VSVTSLFVAVLGVAFPFALGWGVGQPVLPAVDELLQRHQR
jgi:hypothetical protein